MVAFKQLLFILLCMGLSNITYAKTYGSMLCKDNPEYDCHTVKRGETWANLFDDPDKKDLVMRVNRMNTPIYPGLKIAIPKNLNDVDPMSLSPFSQQIDAPGEKVIIVTLKDLAWGAYTADGQLLSWGPVSGGQEWCPDIRRGCRTVTGTFKIYRKQGAKCVSSKFPVPRGGAPMPYCMYFHDGYALHGSWLPGYNASHGCVRLFPGDAKWLNEDFLSDEPGATVIIKRT